MERDFFSDTLRNYQSRSASPNNRHRPPQFLSLLPETRPPNTQPPQQEALQYRQQAARSVPPMLEQIPVNRVVAPVVPFQQPAAPVAQQHSAPATQLPAQPVRPMQQQPAQGNQQVPPQAPLPPLPWWKWWQWSLKFLNTIDNIGMMMTIKMMNTSTWCMSLILHMARLSASSRKL